MQHIRKYRRVRRHVLLAAAIPAIAWGVTATPAAAQTSTMYLETAAITGTAGTIRAIRVPVKNSVGAITYKDISIPFAVDSTGRVTAGTVSIVASPTLITGTFKPGKYKLPSYSETYVVGSPGAGTGGRITTTVSGYRFTGTWVSGSVAGHPYEAKLRAANVPTTAQGWGVVGDESLIGWTAGDILLASQAGDTVTVVNYGNDNIPDTSLTFIACPTCY